MNLKLSVVIPTRNRPTELSRLLSGLREQTLSPASFEVIVVDDGSDSPLAHELSQTDQAFLLRVLRRDADHGAHAARLAGLHAAAAPRVLFLDDDVVAEPTVLTAHADAQLSGKLALGRILYPELRPASPFFRYMAAFYARCDRRIEAAGGRLVPGEYYICNSSGPKALLLAAFADVAAAYPHPLDGGEFDEGLLALVFAARGITPVFAGGALLWHYDAKTLAQARREWLASGESTGRMLLEQRMPLAGWHLNTAICGRTTGAWLRRTAMRFYWAFPESFLGLADALARLAEGRWQNQVPASACHLPMRLARWEGMRRMIPLFADLMRMAQTGAHS